MRDSPAIPSVKVLRDVLEDMLGRDVKIIVSDPWTPSLLDLGTIAVYVDDSTRLRAFITCDLALSVALGASIALIPARTAAACIVDGVLTTDIRENLNEVLNILTNMFNLHDQPHVKLFAVHPPREMPKPEVAQHLARGKREDLTMEVAGYGGGRLALIVV